jgi:hypothetical protein
MSLHIVVNGRARALVASDSRASVANGDFSDDHCKTFAAGMRTVLGVEGLLGFRFDPKLTERRTRDVSARRGFQDKPRELLEALCGEMSPYLARRVHDKPLMLFSAIAFSKAVDGAATLYELEFLVKEDLRLAEPTLEPFAESCDRPFIYALGHGDCLEPLQRHYFNPDALSAEEAIRQVDQIFAAAIAAGGECAADIGFPIDVLALDSEGLRWLRRKTIVADERFFTRLCRSIPAFRLPSRVRTGWSRQR